MSEKTGYPHDILELIDKTAEAFSAAKNIADAEAAWDHFYRVEGYIEMTWPTDRKMLEALAQLKRYLSQFTSDVRNGYPSPFSGWAGTLGRLRSLVDVQYGPDGYPNR